MIIRRETPADREAIADVHRGAFSTPEGREPVEVALVDALREDPGWVPELSLVAVDVEPRVVGHVCLTRGDLAGTPVLGLGPLGVLPHLQGRGIGAALMHAALGAVEAMGEPVVVLLVERRYYDRFGFVPASGLGIAAPDPEWREHFQARTLSAWRGDLRGVYRYAAPFAGVG